jgi:hypothetical protein
MEDQLGAPGPVLNCVVLWNTFYIDRGPHLVVRPPNQPQPPRLLRDLTYDDEDHDDPPKQTTTLTAGSCSSVPRTPLSRSALTGFSVPILPRPLTGDYTWKTSLKTGGGKYRALRTPNP